MADTKAEPNVESDVNAESRDEEEPKREITQTGMVHCADCCRYHHAYRLTVQLYSKCQQ